MAQDTHSNLPLTHAPASQRTVILFSIGIILFWAAMYVYTPVFPVYASSLGATGTIVGLAVGAYGLTQMILRIPLGIWSDAIGKRRIFVVAGMLICAIAAVGFVFSTTPSGLILFRGVMGVSAATWVCSTVLFTSYFPNRHPSYPLSIMTFCSATGQVVAVMLGGILAERLGWIAPFWASVIISLVAAVVLFGVPEDVTARAMPVTKEGMLRTASDHSLLLACGVGVVMMFATWATASTFTPILAADRLHASKAQLGYLSTIGMLAYAIGPFLAVRAVRRFGELPTLAAGLLAMTIGILPTPLIDSLQGLYVLQFISGFGRGLLYPVLMSLAIKTAPPKDRAAAMGIFQAVYALGMFVGPWFSGSITDSFGIDAVFYICGIMTLCCIPVLFALMHRSAPPAARA